MVENLILNIVLGVWQQQLLLQSLWVLVAIIRAIKRDAWCELQFLQLFQKQSLAAGPTEEKYSIVSRYSGVTIKCNILDAVHGKRMSFF